MQWGDEGKGKITDLMAGEMDMVVRYQGGNNAGHTVVTENQQLRLHHIPSGILYPHIICVIGNGMVINAQVLLDEISNLESKGISTDNLRMSSNAHLIMPYHLILDQAAELRLGKSKIGTTHKGIGPAYADKASRIGVRVQDLLDMKIFRAKVEQVLKDKNAILTRVYGLEPLRSEEIIAQAEEHAQQLKKYITDTALLINEALDRGKNVFFEGAQGTFLDLDHGTYPFVTSSSPVAGGACVGAGVSPLRVNRVLGVTKAYVTRVGSGPFPTEQENEIGSGMCELGREYGTTTGRKRRCGWFDSIMLKYAVRINGVTSLALTKLDVLSQFDTLKICVSYEFEGKVYTEFPPHQTIFHKCLPVYEELEGWKEDISNIKSFEELPLPAKRYVRRIEEIASVPVEIISVGPKREQTIGVRTE
jgi:adenylosuccinate synthase